MNLKKAIVFSILMENDSGILGKAPSYVNEKLKSVENIEKCENLLDANNLTKFKDWQKRWATSFSKTSLMICDICYREFEENGMRGTICDKCHDIVGKGDGYKSMVSEDDANKWLEGSEERKEKLKAEGKLE